MTWIMSLLSWLFSRRPRVSPAPAGVSSPPQPAPEAAVPPQSPDLSTRWERCSRWILAREGGFVDNPKDPGGATNMGISTPELTVYLGRPATVDDVRNLGQDVALTIYYHDYWHSNRCDEMPPGVDLAFMDALVMTSAVRVRKWLQSVLRVDQDGVIGQATMAALRDSNQSVVIQNFSMTRMNYYRTLPTWTTFGDGWASRVQQTTTAALEDSQQQRPGA